MSGVDVALDLPRTRQLSVGMRAYAEELCARMPRVAPDLAFATLPRSTALSREEQLTLPRALRALRPRLVHHLSVYAPLLGPRPYVVTIHDLIHLRYPQYFKRSVGPYYRTIVRAVCARAAAVITDDARTIDDLGRYLGVPERKIRIVPLGVDDRYLLPARPAMRPRPYLLYVGNHREHKDLPTLFAAWAALDPALEADLVLTGDDDLGDAMRPARARGSIVFTGDLPPEALPALYAGAVALVHPALYEGFGLPMLEAAALGTPVIASDDAIPADLRPYAGTFAPRDVRGLAALLDEHLRSPRRAAAAAAIARAMTWDRCARGTAEVYRGLLAQSPRR